MKSVMEKLLSLSSAGKLENLRLSPSSSLPLILDYCLVLGLCCVNKTSGLVVEVEWHNSTKSEFGCAVSFHLNSYHSMSFLSHSFSRTRLMRENVLFGEFFMTGPQVPQPEMEISRSVVVLNVKTNTNTKTEPAVKPF